MTGNLSTFDTLWDESGLQEIAVQAKTLSKEECRAIYGYLERKRPKVFLEFGTQWGCSAAMFLKMFKWLGLDVEFHTWDVLGAIKFIDKRHFHLEDVTGKEAEIIKQYKPDFIFIDCHSYELIGNLIPLCLAQKIDFACHDVGSEAITRSEIFWEYYWLIKLLEGNNNVITTCVKDRYGICVVEYKN